jgi:hypothetical protein
MQSHLIHRPTQEDYWRWGLPSVLLAILSAILTVLYLWIQPGIQPRYESIVDAALAGRDDTALDDGASMVRLRELREAEIAAQRLVTLAPDGFEPRWNAAQLAFLVSNTFRGLGRVASDQSDASASNRWNALAKESEERGVAVMRRAAELSDPESRRAQLWIVEKEAFRSLEAITLQGSDWQALALQCRSVGDASEPLPETSELYGSLLILAALAPDDALTDSERRENIRRAITVLASASPRSLTGDVWLAEAKGAEGKGSELGGLRSARATLFAAVQAADDRQRVALTDATFRSMLMSLSIREAGSFAMTQIGLAPSEQRELLRHTIAQSVMRRMVGMRLLASGANEPSDAGSRDVAALLELAMQVGADLPPITKLIRQLLVATHETQLAAFVASQLERTEGATLSDWMRWIRESLHASSSIAPLTEAVPGALRTPSMVIGSLPAVMMAVRQGDVTPSAAERVLAELMRTFPESVDIRFLRAALCVEGGQVAEAIEILEALQAQLPGNENIDGMLRKARERDPSVGG